MARLVWFVVALLGLSLVVPQAHAAETSASCVSGPTWTVKADWGDTGATTPLKVSWTGTADRVPTSWEVRTYNSDGTFYKYTANTDYFDYQQGAAFKSYTPKPPAGPTPKVLVWLGITGGAAKCRVDLTPPSTDTGPVVLFRDEFNDPAGTPANPEHWTDYGPKVNPRFGFGKIKDGNNEVTDGLGNLVIPATPTAGSGLMTAGKFTLKYGTISYRFKMPKTPGYWSAGWSENDITNNDRIEVDTVEHYSWKKNPSAANPNGDAAYSHALVHGWKGAGSSQWGSGDPYCNLPGFPDLGDDFHTYTSVISPTTISSYVDGVQCGSTVNKDKHPDFWPIYPTNDKELYLIMNLAVGGACSPCQPTPVTDDALLVDWVEVTDKVTAP